VHELQTNLADKQLLCPLQVWKPKQSTTQTAVNKGQTMPKKLRYVAGLRGGPATRMNVVQLELDLGQPHQY
jgi:hypothetical protein